MEESGSAGSGGSGSDGDDDADSEDGVNGNVGWADSMAKILKSNKPKGKKTLILSKAKKHKITVKKEPKADFEVIDEDGEDKKDIVIKKEEDNEEEEPVVKKVDYCFYFFRHYTIFFNFNHLIFIET